MNEFEWVLEGILVKIVVNIIVIVVLSSLYSFG